MKKILLTIVLIIGILSCGMPKEVEYPNENLKIENNMVLYKNKKYNNYSCIYSLIHTHSSKIIKIKIHEHLYLS